MYNVGDRLTQFNYIDDTRLKRTAWLTPSHFPSTSVLGIESGTDDPKWKVHYEDNNTTAGGFDYLTYLGQNGKTYLVWVHAQYDTSGNKTSWWMPHQEKDGPKHDDSNIFAIRDWDNNPARLQVDAGILAKDGTPGFTAINLV